jgi:hypothetical protein
VNINIHALLWIETTLAILVVIRYGFIAATESDSPRKGRARLIATLAFGSWFCISALSMIIYNASLPVFEFGGEIESVQIIHSDSRHYSAFLRIHTLAGGNITIHYSGRNEYFRKGEHLKVRYQGDTGELLKATFLAPDGRQEGVFNGTSTWQPYLVLLPGLFAIWAGFKKFHRDPEAVEDTTWRNPSLLDSVDDDSADENPALDSPQAGIVSRRE